MSLNRHVSISDNNIHLATSSCAAQEHPMMILVEALGYDVPCSDKRAMEENALKVLRGCDDEFDPFVQLSSHRKDTPTDEHHISSLSNSSGDNQKENPTLIDEIFEALRIHTVHGEASNTVSSNFFFRDFIMHTCTYVKNVRMYHI